MTVKTNVGFIKSAVLKKEVGLIVTHETFDQAYEYVKYILKGERLGNLLISPSILLENKNQEENIYGFELNYTSELESILVDIFETNDIELYPIPFQMDDTVQIIKNGKNAELLMMGQFVKKADYETIRKIAELMSNEYEIKIQEKNKLQPSILPLPDYFLLTEDMIRESVAFKSDLPSLIEELLLLLENEKVSGEKFYYFATNEEFYLFHEHQVNRQLNQERFECWTVTWVKSDGMMNSNEPNDVEEVLDTLESLKRDGQNMDYVNVFPPNSSLNKIELEKLK